MAKLIGGSGKLEQGGKSRANKTRRNLRHSLTLGRNNLEAMLENSMDMDIKSPNSSIIVQV